MLMDKLKARLVTVNQVYQLLHYNPKKTFFKNAASLPKVISGLYYKLITTVNDDSRVVNKLETSLTDNARVIVYDRHMFIVKATGWPEEIEKNQQILRKRSQNSWKAKNGQTFTPKLNLKVQNICIKQFWSLKIPTTSHVFKLLVRWKCPSKMSPKNVFIILATYSPKTFVWPSKK